MFFIHALTHIEIQPALGRANQKLYHASILTRLFAAERERAEVPHWREPLGQGLWVQVFLHYVDANGPYTDYALDRRERLGPVSLPVENRPGINLPNRDGEPASN